MGEQISLTATEVIMRDEEIKSFRIIDHSIIVRSQPNGGTQIYVKR